MELVAAEEANLKSEYHNKKRLNNVLHWQHGKDGGDGGEAVRGHRGHLSCRRAL